MILSAVVVVSVLSLLPFSRGLTLNARNDRKFVCPDTNTDGTGLSTSTTDDSTMSCSYFGESSNSCSYGVATGTLVGGSGGCPEQATQQPFTRRSRQLKQAIMRRGVYEGKSNERKPAPSPWKREGSPSSHPKQTLASPTWHKVSDSWPDPKPTPPPSPPPWKPGTQPSRQQPCNCRCPQKDLAKNSLTNGAIRDSFLYCSYSRPDCETCSFCKYSTKTGLLLEDNDDGNCSQTATLAQPWDRRYI